MSGIAHRERAEVATYTELEITPAHQRRARENRDQTRPPGPAQQLPLRPRSKISTQGVTAASSTAKPLTQHLQQPKDRPVRQRSPQPERHPHPPQQLRESSSSRSKEQAEKMQALSKIVISRGPDTRLHTLLLGTSSREEEKTRRRSHHRQANTGPTPATQAPLQPHSPQHQSGARAPPQLRLRSTRADPSLGGGAGAHPPLHVAALNPEPLLWLLAGGTRKAPGQLNPRNSKRLPQEASERCQKAQAGPLPAESAQESRGHSREEIHTLRPAE
ncbi:hypothetical protein NDU88_004089 [Pleurodeles waltl]|uniref:Uncharacterized protein n=1 Tax=Pleurodeles waltl TaxID=8319 RepID=A0AAV7QAV4_PLEWA|nr:hypothetical protein NDU88_004089 [Pleurodeles waltl]